MLVTIPSPRAVARTNYMGDVWVVGAAYATHGNARGGLTLGLYDDGDETTWDSNPEAIVRPCARVLHPPPPRVGRA